MSNFQDRLAKLSPEQRQLLEAMLRKQAQQEEPAQTKPESEATPANRQRIPRRQQTDALPLSFAQQRIWMLDHIHPGNALFNIRITVRLSGQLHFHTLRRCIDTLVLRHEGLRTVFAMGERQPVQVIAKTLSIELPVIDIRTLPTTEREIVTQQLATDEALRLFDLAQGPLFRAQLVQIETIEYVLSLTVHHSVADGWSISVLLQELTQLYDAFIKGQSSPLPALPIQYADYALWQRERLQGARLEEHIGYWRDKLANLPMFELPPDHQRPPVQTFRNVRVRQVLEGPAVTTLQQLSKQSGVTLYMTLLSAFLTLLYRHTYQEDLVVGTPIAGRTDEDVEGLIGIFVNLLVLRTVVDRSMTFRSLLLQVRETCLDAYAHQEVPFGMVIEALQPRRDMSRTPFFQIFFNMLNFPDMQTSVEGLTLKRLSPIEAGAKFDITLYIKPEPQRLQLDLVYNADLFNDKRMQVFLAQLQHLLQGVAADPDQPLNQYALLEEHTLAVVPDPTKLLQSVWSGTAFARLGYWAQEIPDQAAVVDIHHSWTYAELERQSDLLAHQLICQGIQPEDIVAVYADRSGSLVWALLGILKAGAAFTMLDPAYPATRLIEQLRITQPRGWLQLESAGALPHALADYVQSQEWACCIPIPTRPTTAFDAAIDAFPTITIQPDARAYVAFTSGSTGQPKGIIGAHRPLSHFLAWHCQTFEITQRDRCSMLSGLAHDPLLRDIFTPLWAGATLYVPPTDVIGNPPQLLNWLHQHRISMMHLTPALGRFLSEGYDASSHNLTQLRYVFFGGDVLTHHDVARVQAIAPSATCVNLYGATETPQAMSYHVVVDHAGTNDDSRTLAMGSPTDLPLGHGIDNVQILVLNAAQQLAGIGEIGEIFVRTPYLSLGYLNDSPATQERFFQNPHTQIAHDRLYRTGDLGRYLLDGTVEFCGRADQQIKIRGFRVELSEIEHVLREHSQIQQGVVIARDDDVNGVQIIAYVVFRVQDLPTHTHGSAETQITSGSTEWLGRIREHLRARLPDYMIPAHMVRIDSLPLTSNGKVNIRALPAPDVSDAAHTRAYIAPRTVVEEVVASMWASVLGVQQISLHDDFFALGGHSLKAARLIVRIRKTFHIDVPIRVLFEMPTIAMLAAYLVAHEAKPGQTEKIATIFQRIRNTSAAERQQLLTQKRRTKSTTDL